MRGESMCAPLMRTPSAKDLVPNTVIAIALPRLVEKTLSPALYFFLESKRS